ncbi:phage head-tail connector protein [Gracilibacillus saliphilus]|uniref:phage head-tail connector protein n=1 Tax=Gracilibacillus saliphilus TaxID=543890 RepID=UPI0013CFCB63|nr:phage head-tail connector protein [Gracilibacillus saliphilus]
MLEKIKTLLAIDDNLQDDVLNIIIENVNSHLRALLGKDVPTELGFIVEEITIRRYNRIGTEGYKTEAVEGHSISFYDLSEEFTPYESIIDKHKDDDGVGTNQGRVLFI